MPADPARVKELFVAAVELPNPAARSAFLDRECGPDNDLRQRVERLLSAHDSEPGSVTTDHVPQPDEGTVIDGRYKLLQPIGEGGMGTVWMAEQLHPVKRKVAVKLVKEGMDSRRVLARFEAERQALALMDHPHIAKVLDAGATDRGSPYFVMELVKGVPLTRFCDDHRLTVPQRLELFQQICSAVQHAHQKGIIHRDLKPGNVLVENHDGRPVPKVIDFGLAKAVSELPLTDKSLFTAFGAVMGTPQYMAPEQASFSAVDVYTRADVYALGVILYELLTGSPPIGTDRLRSAALDEVLRVIREEEPPTPSVRLSTAEGVPSVAANRQTEPKKLGRLVRGELDWIVMKALAKDRGRRYETATGFGADVGRYLAGEPVLAVPPSAGYRLRTFVRRNRAAVTATAVVVMAVLTGAAAATWQAVRATAAERAARESAHRADEERSSADAARLLADEQRARAEETAGSLRIDADLAAYQQDTALGLLSLADTLRRLPGQAQALRDFTTLAVLGGVGEYAPLLAPPTHDGHQIIDRHLAPDGRTLMTLGSDATVRLWDAPSGRALCDLPFGPERLVSCGFSPDGRTAYTETADGVVKLWNSPGGTLRANTEPRPQRYRTRLPRMPSLGGQSVQIAGTRLLVRRTTMIATSGEFGESDGPVELWELTTGRHIARLDRPELESISFELLGGGRWISAVERAKSQRWLLSSEDGRQVAQLDSYVRAVSPTGRWLLSNAEHGKLVVWDTSNWTRNVQDLPTRPTSEYGDELRYIADDIFVYGYFDIGWWLYRHDQQSSARLVRFMGLA